MASTFPSFSTTQPINGKPFDVTLKVSELLRITRDNHTWMAAYVGIMDNPYDAVTGTDGSFTIANVPVGKQPVKAWHEVMGMRADVEARGLRAYTRADGCCSRRAARVPIGRY